MSRKLNTTARYTKHHQQPHSSHIIIRQSTLQKLVQSYKEADCPPQGIFYWQLKLNRY